MFAKALDAARESVDDRRLAEGRRRAAALGLEAGLAWVGALARGERE